MQTFPMFLKLAGRRVVVLGGSEEAAQKTRLMLKTEAQIVLVSPELNAELSGYVAAGRVHEGTVADLPGAALAFAASGCAGADAAHAALAKAHGVLVNAVDAPELCDAFTPAIVDRDPVVVAIGTEGAAPVLARRIKSDLEASLEPGLGRFVAAAGAMRGAVAQRIGKDKRRAFWGWVFDVLRPAHANDEELALDRLAQAVERGAPDGGGPGSVSLVGAGPGGADLLTLRGLKRLQEADVILHDRLADPAILELARRDAERIDVGKAPGDANRPEAWRQERIDRLIVRLASEGKRVVRLKSGDPGIFGRATEEIDACEEAGIEVEIVPGITAASAATAQFGGCLTERDRIDAITLATARSSDGEACTAAARMRPGEQVALYMGVGKVAEVEAAFRANCPGDLDCVLVERAGRADARRVTCRLDQLAATVAEEKVENPAVIFIRWPKKAAAAVVPVPAIA
ncbi:siroheme synthase CysG [Pontivivens ytuae]|uniref:Uroporphyrinogen-III C-methyltransferase n=1 Tax=Pontivivens ytuae TaxID=2789856 RepID=A0A7S9QBE3_9RHOB|nr:siroheme synthase CysG [Pontivivens ytuae]QPH52252.1 uroporphyrinogen-III C-methyltransferase [Pontivivens ytuae]